MLNVQRTSSLFLALPLVLLAGCHKGPSEGVVATVNGHAIQDTDVDKVYKAQLANNPQQQTPSQDQADALRLQILKELVMEEIEEQRAAKLGLTATDSEVDAKLQEMKAPFTEDQFQARLKASNLSMDDIRHDLRRSLTQNKLLNKEINSKITVTDADVATYYNAHKAEFNLIENSYHLAEIRVTTQPAQQAGNLQGSKATTDDEAKKKIEALKTRLDTGEDFGQLAQMFSERQETAANGGDVGFVPESQLKADAAAFAAIGKLKAGQITEILPIFDPATHKPAAYTIYKLISKEPAGQRDLNDPRVQQAIRQQLHDSRSQLLKSAYIEMLRDQAKVEDYLAETIFKNSAK